jgi:catechol 2,3-dioxygenase-like lactoylglutathione lyase family enzyme
MDQRISFVTLAVSDLDATRSFYIDGLGWSPEVEVAGEVMMLRADKHLVLSFWDRAHFAEEIGAEPSRGVPPFTLSHNVRTREEVEPILAEASSLGARVIGAVEQSWGGFTGYFTDPDGFFWEIAWNPQEIGQSVIPG